MKSKGCVLFSGGSDSFCAAAICCESFTEVHLLTFFEEATKNSPMPTFNIEKLKEKYPHTKIEHFSISTDSFVKKLSYDNYFRNILKFHFLNLATPGLSSLSWHMAAIIHCRTHQISEVFDGMTKELLHLPGHMPEIRFLFTELYQNYKIKFSSPVLEWEVPEDQRFIDKLIVDRHGFTWLPKSKSKTTGQWLFERELLPHPNVKGSQFDRLMQHDCYPFVIYNMLVFWLYEPLVGYEVFKLKLNTFMNEKINLAKTLINQKTSHDTKV